MKAIRIFLLVLIIIGIISLCTQSIWVPKLVNRILESENISVETTTNYKNISYTIEGEPVTLVNGRSDSSFVPESTSKTITQYFGNVATGDLNGDGAPDVAFILTQDSGGSGTGFYVVVALKTINGYVGTNGVYLGDRIAPQTTEIQNQQLIVNYADRAVDEPMSSKPSVAVSKYLIVHGTTLEVSQPGSN